MRFSQHFRMSVTRRGEKESRIAGFIARGVEAIGCAGPGSAAESSERAILVIARSTQSPVVKSIATQAREIAAAGCSVRMVLVRGDSATPADTLIAVQEAALDCEVRRARNPGLIEAHEQLVIGRRACWTGDSMRRDPAICDAYESFVEDCPEIAAAAAATFERLWSDASALIAGPAPIGAAALGMPKAIDPRAAR